LHAGGGTLETEQIDGGLVPINQLVSFGGNEPNQEFDPPSRTIKQILYRP
jgi:hypothetical protein